MTAEMLVAVTGFLVGISGVWLNLRGMRDQRRQQDAATLALRDKSRLDETQTNLDAAMLRADRAEARETREQERADRLEKVVTDLRQEVDEAHLYRRQQLSAIGSACREETGQLLDVISTLKAIVTDEIAMSAAKTVLDEVKQHPHGEPLDDEGV